MTFQVGQRVRHRTRDVSGTVLECDGSTVYLETATGVELQFRSEDLVGGDAPRATPIAADSPEQLETLRLIPERVVAMAAVAYAKSKDRRGSWEALPARLKLEKIAAATALSGAELDRLARSGQARHIEAHAAIALGKRRQ